MEREVGANGSTVTLRDVAAVAGVHTGTASRALNPATRPLVNQETAQRVLAAAERLGYRPNPIARGLKTNRSLTVGVVIPDLRNPLFPPIARGIDDGLEPSGYTTLLANTDHDPARERASFDALRARQVDGFITATARLDDPFLDALAASGVPIVLVNRRTDGDTLPYAVADDHGGARAAVEHLVELGHRRIAHVTGSLTLSSGRARYEGFLDALRDAGIEHDPDLVQVGLAFTEAEGERLCSALLDDGRRFTAVVAGNDLIALGCLDALRARGLSCPRDVSIVGYNDMDFSDRFDPPLTTVHVPHYELGVEAAGLLLDLLGATSAPRGSVVLPADLVVRGSTAPCPLTP